jgi:hypothetical protein
MAGITSGVGSLTRMGEQAIYNKVGFATSWEVAKRALGQGALATVREFTVFSTLGAASHAMVNQGLYEFRIWEYIGYC